MDNTLTWIMGLVAVALHVCAATFMMRHHARSVIGWRITLAKGLLGQGVIALASLIIAGLTMLALDEAGLPPSVGVYLLVFMAFLIAWGFCQLQLTDWMSHREPGLYLSVVRARRITAGTILYLGGLYVALALAGLGLNRRLLSETSIATGVAGDSYAAPAPERDAHTGNTVASTNAPAAEPAPASKAAPVAAAPNVAAPAAASSKAASSAATPVASAPVAAPNPQPAGAKPSAPPSAATPRMPAPPSASPDPAGAPVAQSTPVRPDTGMVLQTVGAWAQAWSRRDIEGYLGFYANDFHPADGLSLAQWKLQRRQRIGAANNISVALESINASLDSPEEATVRFRQVYKSDRLSEVEAKRLHLRLQQGNWRIVGEQKDS